ncbi:MAG: cupin domain-containing protein [Sneathiella sp.]|nr:cupin domain-containing protein [Sneathiella sp.]
MDFGFDLRRIVTGHNAKGRSEITLDGPPSRRIGNLRDIWNEEGHKVDSHDVSDRGAMPVNLSPVANGSNFRWFAVQPADPSISEEEMRKIVKDRFAAMGAAHEQPDTTRHPAMHKTGTIDYIILLSGEVTLLLDDDETDLKPFDVVVQRGTNHAWVNKGTEPALLCAILIDAEIA